MKKLIDENRGLRMILNSAYGSMPSSIIIDETNNGGSFELSSTGIRNINMKYNMNIRKISKIAKRIKKIKKILDAR